MEPKVEKPESGLFKMNLHKGDVKLTRYFQFPDTELHFEVNLGKPRELKVRDLHRESLKILIGHLQEMLDAAEAARETAP